MIGQQRNQDGKESKHLNCATVWNKVIPEPCSQLFPSRRFSSLFFFISGGDD